jgi:hypothetical protein
MGSMRISRNAINQVPKESNLDYNREQTTCQWFLSVECRFRFFDVVKQAPNDIRALSGEPWAEKRSAWPLNGIVVSFDMADYPTWE